MVPISLAKEMSIHLKLPRSFSQRTFRHNGKGVADYRHNARGVSFETRPGIVPICHLREATNYSNPKSLYVACVSPCFVMLLFTLLTLFMGLLT